MNLEQDAIVRIRSLNKTFTGRAGKVTALDGIDLDIRRGEIFGIIGLSGAGKSTLVRCINFLEKPTAGTVTVDGQELGSLSKKQLLEARRSMGMIFQQFNLLQQRTGCKVYLPPEELGFADTPILEPAFLYGGRPPKVLRNKFLMAPSCQAEPLTPEALMLLYTKKAVRESPP